MNSSPSCLCAHGWRVCGQQTAANCGSRPGATVMAADAGYLGVLQRRRSAVTVRRRPVTRCEARCRAVGSRPAPCAWVRRSDRACHAPSTCGRQSVRSIVRPRWAVGPVTPPGFIWRPAANVTPQDTLPRRAVFAERRHGAPKVSPACCAAQKSDAARRPMLLRLHLTFSSSPSPQLSPEAQKSAFAAIPDLL